MKNFLLKNSVCIIILLLINFSTVAQQYGRSREGETGQVYGRILDAKTGKPIMAASVQLFNKNITTSNSKSKDSILATNITKANGDFSIENIPLRGKYLISISAVGYKTLTKDVSFSTQQFGNGSSQPNTETQVDFSSSNEKNLGNIKLEEDTSTLAAVTVTATKPFFEMGVDRKIFNVDKNISPQGLTGVEVMKQIPTVNVDIDGNVTVRNMTPQIFIDDRPTTLTLDQIPADIIDRVELITNPSAKYDASGGGAGIINIVLKKNKKKGYYGGLRTGIDSRARINAGGDINYRQGKFNFFASANYNQRKSLVDFSTIRNNLSQAEKNIVTNGNSTNKGYSMFFRGGLDFYADNRNTISIAGNYNKGGFRNNQFQVVDSTINGTYTSFTNIYNNAAFNFNNGGGQFTYKHNFAGTQHDINTDINYNESNNSNTLFINLESFLPDTSINGSPFIQQVTNNGYNRFLTIQSDYENQITKKIKIEAGARAAIRNFYNNNEQYAYDFFSNKYVFLPYLSAGYTFKDQVYAAYSTFTEKQKKWNLQGGLRLENSYYNGNLLGKDSAFKISYPLSLFPSAFVTYHIDKSQDIQINYSRRINRPNFFQLMPFYDFTDPQNPVVGNAALRPEFTNSLEASYFINYSRGASILASVYGKFTNDLITRYQYKDLNISTPSPNDSVVYATFANANSSSSFGLEFTNKLFLFNAWDFSVNTNFFYSNINGENLKIGNSNNQLSWFLKTNSNVKLPKSFSVQFSADYYSKTILPANSGGGTGGSSGGGGGQGRFGSGFGGLNIATAQGYTLPRFDADFAIKKDWQWKGGKSASLSISMNDIFHTNYYRVYTENPFFNQSVKRIRDPQVLRLNFSYRFGNADATLFKKKSNKSDNNGTDYLNSVQ